MQQQDNHEYPFLYQRQTCHQVQPNQATYQKRQKCQPATYLRSEERFSRNAETDLVCRLLLEKKKARLLNPLLGSIAAGSDRLGLGHPSHHRVAELPRLLGLAAV